MKREIKFRAWDKKTERMWDIETWHIADEYVDLIEPGKSIADINAERFWRKQHEIILMQSTGLKDNNGVEVYDGDIVSFEDSDGGYEYQDVVINAGIVEYGELGFYFTNRVAVEMDDFYIKDGRCDGIEVIGNIYENQELLEDGK